MAAGKRFRAAVIGGSGYGGAEMIRRLLFHPHVELVRVASVDFVGEPLSAADPALEQVTDLVFEDLAPREAAKGVDVVLLGLPHTVAAQKVPELADLPGLRIIDMSGDFRLKSREAYERHYKHVHPCPERLADFVYGLPELNREKIRAARLVASPGCFATTVELALLPLARAGLLDGVVHVQGITGSSGSGVAPSAGTHHPVRAGNLKAYKPLEHQHVPEIQEALAEAWTQARLDALYRETFQGEPFVRVPRRRLPEVAAVAGSNFAEVGVVVGPARGGRRTATVFGATDNLVKGGAGQAIQNMNLMLGLDEKASLAAPGPWPP